MTSLFRSDLSRWQDSEPIGGVLYPASIAWLWSDAALEEIGLYKPKAAEAVPQGMQVLSTAPQWVDGVMRYVNVMEPEVSTPRQPTRAQAESALFHYRLPDGSDPGYFDQYEALIQNHPDARVRIWAKGANVWREDHPYVLALALEMHPPINEEEMVKLFDAAITFEA